MDNSNYTIAIDGLAGAGKSTIAKSVAKALEIDYIDTGAMYRALTLKLLNNNLDPKNSSDVIAILDKTNIDFKDNNIYLDGLVVNDDIRQNQVSNNVSYVAIVKDVRDKFVALQRNMAKSKPVVMDGRDIGTVVFPDSKYKFFITASVDERAKRRSKDLVAQGETRITLEQIKEDIIKRDHIDSNREISPLKVAEGSHIIDTTNKTIDESVNIITSIVLDRGEE